MSTQKVMLNLNIDSFIKLPQVVLSIIRAKFWKCYTNTFYLWIYWNLSIFVNIYKYLYLYYYLYFRKKFAEMDKRKRKPKRHLQFTISTDRKSWKNIFNVKSCEIQQPIRYFKLFANWCINIPLTDFWEKVNSVQ